MIDDHSLFDLHNHLKLNTEVRTLFKLLYLESVRNVSTHLQGCWTLQDSNDKTSRYNIAIFFSGLMYRIQEMRSPLP